MNTGRVVAMALAATVNVGMLSGVGWMARALGAQRKALVASFLVVAGCVTGLEWLWAGYEWQHVRRGALVAALFVVASRLQDSARAADSR